MMMVAKPSPEIIVWRLGKGTITPHRSNLRPYFHQRFSVMNKKTEMEVQITAEGSTAGPAMRCPFVKRPEVMALLNALYGM
jgi:hypothetical protein